MKETESDEFARLWAQDPEPEEVQLFERLARRVGWRSRLLRYADVGGAIVIVGGIVVLMLREGGRLTAVSGLLLVLGLTCLAWKRNTLWEAELDPAADRETFLLASARAAKARLRRMNLGVVSVLPLASLALWFGYRYRHPEIDSMGAAMAEALARPVATSLLVATIVGLQLYALIARRRVAAELRSIEELARQYGEEVLFEHRTDSVE
jgi:hypothetical protein